MSDRYASPCLTLCRSFSRTPTISGNIQLSLIGAAGYVKIGNSLTDPMTKDDGAKNYWYTPMYFSDVWHWRRVWHSVDRLMRQPTDEHNEGEKLHDAAPGKEDAND